MYAPTTTMPTRLFLSQSVLDRWLSDGTAEVSGDTLTIAAEGRTFDLKTAVLFEREVTESGDKHGLLGKVKELEQLARFGGDYSAGTVIVGDEAYEVTDGFTGFAVRGDLLPALASIAPPALSETPSHRPTEPELGLVTAAPSFAGATSPGMRAAGDIEAALGSASEGAAAAKESELDLLARFFLEKH
jgi:hypothetical protein